MSTQFVAALEAEIESLRDALNQDVRFVRLREAERLRELYRDLDGENDALSATYVGGLRRIPKPPLRKASPERAQAIESSRLYVMNRVGPVPTVDIYEHVKGLGITIRGENPVNNLSAMLSNSGVFKANGRAGWTIRIPEDNETNSEAGEESGRPRDDDETEHEAAERHAALSAEIAEADRLYHGEDTPEITDAAYDALRRELEEIEARFPNFVGSGEASGTPVSRVSQSAGPAVRSRTRPAPPQYDLDDDIPL